MYRSDAWNLPDCKKPSSIAPPIAPTPIIDSFIEKIKSPIKPHPRPLPRREGSDVMDYLKPKTSPVGRGMVCWATLFYCLFKSYYYLIPKTPPSNHTPPLTAGEGLGVGLCMALWAYKHLLNFSTNSSACCFVKHNGGSRRRMLVEAHPVKQCSSWMSRERTSL